MIDETTAVVRLHNGHTVFEINHVTKSVDLADTFPDAKNPNLTRIIKKPGCDYVGALNMKNAVKQFNKNK